MKSINEAIIREMVAGSTFQVALSDVRALLRTDDGGRITQHQAAKILDVDKKTYWSWENGKALPSFFFWHRLAEFMQMSTEDLGRIVGRSV